MGFNKQQQEAIDANIKTNVLISAGAGSGKTKILSTKVFHLIHDDKLDPSSLLVLTFTNKAAFEMKERIIQQFKDNDPGSLDSDKILSAHIQTFDSFSLYLAKKYSMLLGLPNSLSIIDESILKPKKNEILDQIMNEYYERNDQAFLTSLKKFNVADDRKTRQAILALDQKLSTYLPSFKKDFMENYDQKYLTEEFFTKAKNEYIDWLKQFIRVSLSKAVFNYNHTGSDYNLIRKDLIESDFDTYYKNGNFNNALVNKVYDDEVNLLDTSADHFFDSVAVLLDSEEFNRKKNSHYFKEGEEDDSIAYKAITDIILANQKYAGSKTFSIKTACKTLADFPSQYQVLLSFKDDIHLLFKIINELDQRLFSYKQSVAGFTFSDVSQMALSLLTDKKYQIAKDEIISRFKYILVDEYQDTNDFQELFLNQISVKATLFCVGDAKQSIYGFRNSNCQLFLDRREKYLQDNNPTQEKVIEMNTNYRSAKKLLDDINMVFTDYMNKDHGGIDYTDMETLNYDSKVNLYDEKKLSPTGEYGINLIGIKNVKPGIISPAMAECQAIIDDILHKVQNHFQVFELGKGLRDCKFADFAILIRKKRNFTPYEEAFVKAGIPLNNDIESSLSDIDAVSLLQSLIKLIACRMGVAKGNIRHLFMSVARSYIFGKDEGYDDNRIYDLVSDQTLTGINQDPLMKQVDAFIKENQNFGFSALFLNLLDEFQVIKKLNHIGGVADNIAKIDSLYNLILNQEKVGDGLKEFVSLFNSIDKYRLDMTSETVYDTSNAVELTTIHKSKGLEYPIVYLPTSDNCLAKDSNMDKPDYDFSKAYGLLLPSYDYGGQVNTFFNQLNSFTEDSNKEDIDENVRLFYVALTRAKLSLYIVGNDNRKEGILSMLDSTFVYSSINEEYFKNYLTLDTNDDYQDLKLKLPLYEKTFFAMKDVIGVDKKESYVFTALDPLRKAINDDNQKLLAKIYKALVDKLNGDSTNAIYRFFTSYYLGQNDLSMKDLFSDSDYLKTLKYYQITPTEAGLADYLDKLKTALTNHDYLFFGFNPKKSDEENESRLINTFTSYLASALDDFKGQLIETHYPFNSRVYDALSPVGQFKEDINKQVKLTNDNSEIKYEVSQKERASKISAASDSITINKESRGLYFHRLLELVDFKTKDTSFIKNPKDRKVIDKVLSLPIFADLKESAVYHEYGYYDQELKTTGFMDCLIVKKDRIDIIDYKLKNISDEAYPKQLQAYARNAALLFPGRLIYVHLLSILDGILQDV
ncbi:MAG: UvrD-helicase domain-containing protein [Bacilli bacterium]